MATLPERQNGQVSNLFSRCEAGGIICLCLFIFVVVFFILTVLINKYKDNTILFVKQCHVFYDSGGCETNKYSIV